MSKSLLQFITLLLFVLLGSGCVHTRNSFEDQPGMVDAKSGDLIAFWLQRVDEEGECKEEPVLVRAPYTVWIVWRGQERRFHIYDNTNKTMFKTAQFDEFLQRLNQLPPGIEILHMDTCTASQAYDMPPAEWQRLEKAMGDRAWALDPRSGIERAIICTCQSKGLRYP